MRPVGDTSISNKFFEACASNFPENREREKGCTTRPVSYFMYICIGRALFVCAQYGRGFSL